MLPEPDPLALAPICPTIPLSNPVTSEINVVSCVEVSPDSRLSTDIVTVSPERPDRA